MTEVEIPRSEQPFEERDTFRTADGVIDEVQTFRRFEGSGDLGKFLLLKGQEKL